MAKSRKEIKEEARRNIEEFLAKVDREVDGAPERYKNAARRGSRSAIPETKYTQTTSFGRRSTYPNNGRSTS